MLKSEAHRMFLPTGPIFICVIIACLRFNFAESEEAKRRRKDAVYCLHTGLPRAVETSMRGETRGLAGHTAGHTRLMRRLLLLLIRLPAGVLCWSERSSRLSYQGPTE